MRSSIGWSARRATATPTETLTAAHAETAEVEAADRGADRARRLRARRRGRVAQQDDELLPAEARRDVVLANRRHDGAATARRTSSPVAWPCVSLRTLNLSMSTMRIADRVVRAPALGEQRHELVEVAAVGQPGQRIGRGLRLGGPVRVGAGKGGRCLGGGRREQATRGVGPAPADPVGEDDRARPPRRPRSAARPGRGSARRRRGRGGRSAPRPPPVGAGRPPSDGIVEIAGREQGCVVGDARVRADESSLQRRSCRVVAATTTMWSARVASPSSSTMASTIASGDTERESPDRMRANDSVSDRLRASSPWTAETCSRAATPATTTATRRNQSIGPASRPRARAIATTPIRRKAPEKSHQDRRIRRSDGSTGRAGRRVGWVTSEIEDGGTGPSRPVPRRGTDGAQGWYFRPTRPHPCPRRACRLRPRRGLLRA